MGFFKKSITNSKSDFFTTTPPLTGGDTLTKTAILQSQDTYNRQTMNLRTSGMYKKDNTGNDDVKLNELFASKNYDTWRLLMFLGDYFTNLFAFRCSSNVILTQLNQLKRVCWLYGNAAIYKLNGVIIPLCITQIQYSNSLVPIYIRGIPAKDVLSAKAQKLDDLNKFNHLEFVIKGDDLKNVVVWQWDDLGYGAIYKLLPFIQQQSEMLEMIYTNSFSFIRKNVMNVGNLNRKWDDIKAWFNTKLPFIVRKQGDGIIDSNKIERLETKGNDSGGDILDYYNKWKTIWYEIIGRRSNLQQKKERNVSSELEMDKMYFDEIQLTIKQNMIIFAKAVYDLIGIDVNVVEVNYDY